MTPTRENVKGFKVYDIPSAPTPQLSRALAQSIKTAMQQYSSDVDISQKIPPSPLPEKATRYEVINPLQNATGLMALAAQAGGGAFEIPRCQGSVLDVTSHRNYAGFENTTFFVCLIPYQKGYSLNVYYSFTRITGGFSTASLGNQLAQSMVGSTGQYIPKTIADIESSVTAQGLPLVTVDGYPN